MARNALSGLDRTRLRRILAVFFLTLSLPTAVLIYQAYKQLKWESFRYHQLQAEDLSSRIDAHLLRLMSLEEGRSFAEYRFLVVEGDDTSNFLQRSPLSVFPVKSGIPGMIGYFQVDADGTLSTPLLPVERGERAIYDIPPRERSEREALQRRISEILADNRLVAGGKKDAAGEAGAPRAPSGGEGVSGQGAAGIKVSALSEREEPVSTAGRREETAAEPASVYGRDDTTLVSAVKPDPEERPSTQPQAAFDLLGESRSQRQAVSKKSVSNLGLVEDLKLEQRFAPEPELRERGAGGGKYSEADVADEVRVLRKERTRLPQPERVRATPVSPAGESVGTDLPIRTFESEVDAFKLSQLDSGEFVMFRNVWRGGERVIQGALVERRPFIEEIVESAFTGTVLSRMSDLIVAYRGEIIDLLGGASGRTYLPDSDALRGELLYRTRLSAPLSELELIFSVTALPAGPGATLINWLATLLPLLLCGGFFLLYRLGCRQIDLARQQQDFISSVSHELKTPLTSIRMYGELLREGWATEEKRRGYYDYIHKESERLSRLIDNVLQLARMTRNRLKIECVPLRADELMEGIRPAVASQVEAAGFDLELTIGDAAAGTVVDVDRDSFTQIIINLVDNGLKFSGRAALKRIDLACREQTDGSVQFSVRDYGPGVPEEQMKKIFKLFYRSENELTRETVGTGIGLALVNQLAQGIKGKVDVVNRDPGAEFRLTLPGRRPPA